MATRSRPSKGYINMASVYRTWADGDAFTAADAGTYFMRQVNISVDNQSDRDAILTPQEGMQVWRKDLDGFELYDGSEWNLVPRLLKKVTLATAGDLISVTGIPARDEFEVRGYVIASGALSWGFRFNNDSSANYTLNISTNFAAPSLVYSLSNLFCGAVGAVSHKVNLKVLNPASRVKLVTGITHDDAGSTLPTSVGNVSQMGGKWYNTSAQINRVDFFNLGAGDFAIGSYVEIWG